VVQYNADLPKDNSSISNIKLSARESEKREENFPTVKSEDCLHNTMKT
jgi:hypothetical protein